MTKSREISKKGFTKEVAMAVLLFCLPLLIPVHLLFDGNKASTFDLFGFKIVNSYNTDQLFVWAVAHQVLGLFYSIIFYTRSKGLIRHVLWFLMWYLAYRLCEEFFYGVEPLSKHYELLTVVFVSILNLITLRMQRFSISKAWTNLRCSSSIERFYALMILLALFLRLSYIIIPDTLIQMDLGFITIGSFGFPDFLSFMWTFGAKLGLLIPLLVWFFMERQWWKYALLSPILVTIYQIRSIFNTETHIMDQYEILQALPLLTLIGLLLISLSKNAKDQYIGSTIYIETKRRIEKMLLHQSQKEADDIEEVRRMFHKLKGERSTMEIEDLKALKKTLENKLRNT